MLVFILRLMPGYRAAGTLAPERAHSDVTRPVLWSMPEIVELAPWIQGGFRSRMPYICLDSQVRSKAYIVVQ